MVLIQLNFISDYFAEAQFQKGPKGADQLICNGYTFFKNHSIRLAKDYIRWSCTNTHKPRCGATTKTKEFGGVTMMQVPSGEHNHPPKQ